MKTVPIFKIRCSAIGKIMTNSRSKSDPLSKTCTSFLDLWIKEKLYARRKEINSKYFDKGHIMEDSALDMVANHLGIAILQKNTKQFENEYMTGEPDGLPDDQVVDTKCSWDFTTFPLMDEMITNKDYEWQLRGYMELTGRKKASLVYCLLDTPMHLIEREARYYCLNNGYEELDDKVFADYVARMTYRDVPDSLKYKSFSIESDDDLIGQIQERVKECRKYIEAKLFTIKY